MRVFRGKCSRYERIFGRNVAVMREFRGNVAVMREFRGNVAVMRESLEEMSPL